MIDRSRLDTIARWLQQADDELLYMPDRPTGETPLPSRPLEEGHYVLEGHTPIPATSLEAWGYWFAEADRCVGRTVLTEDVEVSTVFLGLDHSFSRGARPPVLFETMVFGGPLDEEQERYTSWEEAEAGHAAMCARVHAALTPELPGGPWPE
jgi:hypothetical protein